MRRSTIVGHVSAACSLFLADQLLARYFWQVRDRGTIVRAREHKRRYETLPTPRHDKIL